MPTLIPTSSSDVVISDDIFGANILGYRDRIGDDGTYDDAIDRLGVGAIRYPGGSYTEEYFDITDPDRVDVESLSGAEDKENMPYSEFMGWAEAEGISVTIVIPTRTQLSESSDANGNRFPEIDETELRQFVRDTLDGVYGSPEIDAFELGNEYWGSGLMTSVEYGRLASEMSVIIRDEIDQHPKAGTHFANLDIAVQMGQNYDHANLSNAYPETGPDLLNRLNQDYGIELDESYLYSDGSGAWPRIQNKLIVNEFDTPEQREAIDAVVAHYYSRGEAGEQGSFDLGIIEKEWDPAIPNLTRYVTEWNLKSNANLDPHSDYGLKNAHEMLNIVENMIDEGVELAHVWAVQQNTRTDLAYDEGRDELTITGEMFAMMSETLPGKQKIKLDGSIPGQDEISTGTADAHFFFGEEGGALYLASTSAESSMETIDLSSLMSDYGEVNITRLGVEDGAAPNSARSAASVTTMTREEAFDGNLLDVDLDPYEILLVTFSGATSTPALDDLLSSSGPPTTPEPPVPPDNDDDDTDDEDDSDPDNEGDGGTCFVATAAYGDPYHPDVTWLREFRDKQLLPHPLGRVMLDLYWEVGPRMARIVRKYPGLSVIARSTIKAFVCLARGK
ncbi:type I secretion protein [Epibacterium sp. DP7N7-1]|nr:type I secretion protein [Epibacterium sp. DP7N7-1]